MSRKWHDRYEEDTHVDDDEEDYDEEYEDEDGAGYQDHESYDASHACRCRCGDDIPACVHAHTEVCISLAEYHAALLNHSCGLAQRCNIAVAAPCSSSSRLRRALGGPRLV